MILGQGIYMANIFLLLEEEIGENLMLPLEGDLVFSSVFGTA